MAKLNRYLIRLMGWADEADPSDFRVVGHLDLAVDEGHVEIVDDQLGVRARTRTA